MKSNGLTSSLVSAVKSTVSLNRLLFFMLGFRFYHSPNKVFLYLPIRSRTNQANIVRDRPSFVVIEVLTKEIDKILIRTGDLIIIQAKLYRVLTGCRVFAPRYEMKNNLSALARFY